MRKITLNKHGFKINYYLYITINNNEQNIIDVFI